MAELSRDDIVAVLGPLDDNVVAEIIATRVTKEGLIAAHARIVEDREKHDPGPPLEPGRSPGSSRSWSGCRWKSC